MSLPISQMSDGHQDAVAQACYQSGAQRWHDAWFLVLFMCAGGMPANLRPKRR